MAQRYLILSIVILLMSGCTRDIESTSTNHQQPTTNNQSPITNSQPLTTNLHIAATFFPLYDMTKSILGDKGIVYAIVPAGIEPHDYEATPGDMLKVSKADAFVTMGIEFAEFEEDIVDAMGSEMSIISAGEGIALIEAEHEDEEHTGRESADEVHDHGSKDPHIWLSPKYAKLMVANIVDGLVIADQGNAEYYTANGQTLTEELGALDSEFRSGLSNCAKDVILVNHNAFSYLARDYGFRIISISGLEPEQEPTPGQLKELVDTARAEGVRYVLYENLVDPRVAQTIAHEVGAQTLELNPLEGSDNPSDTYITLMRENLKALRIALECP